MIRYRDFKFKLTLTNLLLIWAFVCYILLLLYSPFFKVRYASSTLGLLLLIPLIASYKFVTKYRARRMAIMTLLLISPAIMLLSVQIKWIRSENLIENWWTKYSHNHIKNDESILIIFEELDSRIRPLIYDLQEKELAVSEGDIDYSLLNQKENAIVMFDFNESNWSEINALKLKNLGYVPSKGNFRGFKVYRRQVPTNQLE